MDTLLHNGDFLLDSPGAAPDGGWEGGTSSAGDDSTHLPQRGLCPQP